MLILQTAMPYGVYPIDFPAPAFFPWVYPVLCGSVTVRQPANPEGNRGGILLYILHGEGEICMNGQSYGYLPDCVAAAPPGAALTIYPQEETGYLFVRLENAGEQIGWIGRSGFLQALPGRKVAEAFLQVCTDGLAGRLNDVWEGSKAAFLLLLAVGAGCDSERSSYSPLVRGALEAIHHDYAFLEGVDGLVQRLGVSKSHLIRQFTSQVGQPPGKLLQQVRMEHAKLLLSNSDYTIEMVAGMSGYSNANYFSKVFRRETGESPGRYRARGLKPAKSTEQERKAFCL